MALSADRATPNRGAGLRRGLPVAASTRIYAGALACVSTSTGYATKGATATTLRAVGVAVEHADNSSGLAGDISVQVERGVWLMLNSASADQLTRADIGADCYIVDDQTVAKTSGSNTRSVAGKVWDVDASGVWVEIG